jgi:hypothetical protein
VRFFSATFGTGVIATQCPVTRPKRQIQPERYAPLYFEFFGGFIKNDLTNKIKLV